MKENEGKEEIDNSKSKLKKFKPPHPSSSSSTTTTTIKAISSKPTHQRTSKLTGEVDECDQFNPLVLHHAKTQLKPLTNQTQPLIFKSSSSSSSNSRSSSTTFTISNHSLYQTSHSKSTSNFKSSHLIGDYKRTKPAITLMCFESVNAIISSNLNSTSNLNLNLIQSKLNPIPIRSTSILNPIYPSLTLRDSIKPIHPFNFINLIRYSTNSKSKETIRLRDVVSRITFRFNETHSCELNCRRVMILIIKSDQTLPPGSMRSIKIGENKVKPPKALIRHQTCESNWKPSIELEWTDGRFERFDPTFLTLDQILFKCHFLPIPFNSNSNS
ncbi:hypothetical protein DFH28DRAFT_1127793 [Melampsora americana]|nr:hypothetical protein DFH28DRAFT_1127793 [Melampsora americana]